jgi:DNA-binding NtrC family response regulator
MVSDLEKTCILQKLKESNWNRERTALLLDITRKKLISRIAKYKIQVPKNKFEEE